MLNINLHIWGFNNKENNLKKKQKNHEKSNSISVNSSFILVMCF